MGGTQWVAIVVSSYLIIVGESPRRPNSAACRGDPVRSLSIASIHGKRVKNQPDPIHHNYLPWESWGHGEGRGTTDLDERL